MNRLRKWLVVMFAVLALGVVGSPNAYADLITNGGFESGTLASWTVPIGNVVGQGTVNVVAVAAPPYWSSSLPRYFTLNPLEGQYMAQLYGDRDAVLQQAFVVPSAGWYNVSFAYNLYAYDWPSTEDGPDIFVALDSGVAFLTVPINDLVGLPVSTTGWQVYSQSHYLAGGAHALQFWSDTYTPGGADNPSSWFFVDAVSVRVPDGATTVLLLGGALIGLGALRRKFRS